MDDSWQRESRRQRTDYIKGGHALWNGIPQYQIRDQNMLLMSTKISMLLVERDTAMEERDRAQSEKMAAIAERDAAIQQRDAAISEREKALRERDNALAALRFQESAFKDALGYSFDHEVNPPIVHITEAIPLTAIPPKPARSRVQKKRKATNNSKKARKVCEDLNRHVTTDGSKAEWDAQGPSSSREVKFDETKMPTPVCSCTGVARPCYKWGSGGWQSSCCTKSISAYPLPQRPNKRHARMGGRKMRVSVFRRLIARIAADGHDLSVPVDLRNYWAKHGTNGYVTIK